MAERNRQRADDSEDSSSRRSMERAGDVLRPGVDELGWDESVRPVRLEQVGKIGRVDAPTSPFADRRQIEGLEEIATRVQNGGRPLEAWIDGENVYGFAPATAKRV